ncbi:MAG TPA: hypothetical protein VI875_01000 [Candidatus Norongarragalinales archaeon]|nr:hypothetical protein [Candidatus Norongarragalinales archaeon]
MNEMRKSQIFSVDFLMAVAVLTVALGIWINSFSTIQKNSVGGIENASAFALADSYYERLSSGVAPAALGCVESAGVVSCGLCTSEERFFVQRFYSSGGSARMLKVGVCSK